MRFALPETERRPFCDNVAGRSTRGGLKCAPVLNRDLTLTFVAPRAAHQSALLVIPKRHAPTLFDLTEAEAKAIWDDVRSVARALTLALQPDGLNIFQNNGRAAGQSVPHYHVHVVPRFLGDEKIPRGIPPLIPIRTRVAIATRIQSRLKR